MACTTCKPSTPQPPARPPVPTTYRLLPPATQEAILDTAACMSAKLAKQAAAYYLENKFERACDAQSKSLLISRLIEALDPPAEWGSCISAALRNQGMVALQRVMQTCDGTGCKPCTMPPCEESLTTPYVVVQSEGNTIGSLNAFSTYNAETGLIIPAGEEEKYQFLIFPIFRNECCTDIIYPPVIVAPDFIEFDFAGLFTLEAIEVLLIQWHYVPGETVTPGWEMTFTFPEESCGGAVVKVVAPACDGAVYPSAYQEVTVPGPITLLPQGVPIVFFYTLDVPLPTNELNLFFDKNACCPDGAITSLVINSSPAGIVGTSVGTTLFGPYPSVPSGASIQNSLLGPAYVGLVTVVITFSTTCGQFDVQFDITVNNP